MFDVKSYSFISRFDFLKEINIYCYLELSIIYGKPTDKLYA